MIVDLDQEYRIQYKEGWSCPIDWLVLAPKWCHLWMEWIRVLWTQLLDPNSKAKCLKCLTWYHIWIWVPYKKSNCVDRMTYCGGEVLWVCIGKFCSWCKTIKTLHSFSLTKNESAQASHNSRNNLRYVLKKMFYVFHQHFWDRLL